MPAGRFRGPLVVTMRPLRAADAIRAVQITSRFPDVHGAPVHLGDPALIGIADLAQPDYGDAVDVLARRAAGVLGLRRHAAGRDAAGAARRSASRTRRASMLITDLLNHQLASF